MVSVRTYVRTYEHAVVDRLVRIVEADVHDAVLRIHVVVQLPVEQRHGYAAGQVEVQWLLDVVYVGQRAHVVRAGDDHVSGRAVVLVQLGPGRLFQVSPHVAVKDLPLWGYVCVVKPIREYNILNVFYFIY